MKQQMMILKEIIGYMTHIFSDSGWCFYCNQECDQMLDRLKLGVVYILENMVKCHHKKIVIDLFYLEVDGHIDAFNYHP